jgi:hypothetical protein
MSVESYAHKAAKATVVKWFRDVSPLSYRPMVCGVDWQVNRGPPHWGIWEEYPVLQNRVGINPVWDEYCFPHVHMVPNRDGAYSPFSDAPPSYQYLKSIGCAPKAILDVAVQHKGAIGCGIEIVHKHGLSHEKLEFLKKAWLCSLLVLPCAWVLGQVSPPLTVPEKFWAWGAPRKW